MMMRLRHSSGFALTVGFLLYFSCVVLAQIKTLRAVPDAFSALDKEVSLRVESVELAAALRELSKQAGVEIVLEGLQAKRPLDAAIEKKPLRDALDDVMLNARLA